MSLHAHLSPEAELRFEAQKRNSVVTSIIIALLAVTLVILVLLFILLPALRVNSPTIVSYNGSLAEDNDMSKKEVNTDVRRQPSAPSSQSARVLVATMPSPVAVPIPETVTPDPSTEFGDGSDFGDGWGRSSLGRPFFRRFKIRYS